MATTTHEEKPKLYSLRELQKMLEFEGFIIPYRTLLSYVEKGYIVPDYVMAFKRKHRYLFTREGLNRTLFKLKQNKIIMENQSWGKFFKAEPLAISNILFSFNFSFNKLKDEWNKLLPKLQGKPEYQPEVANLALIIKDLEETQRLYKQVVIM